MKIPYIKPEFKVLNLRDFCSEDDDPETISFGTLAPKNDLDADEEQGQDNYWRKFDWQ
ncbi:hypothetical protein [Pseudoprevotella muciniphila]|uniref:hypothetical protein n=1 Tax=Pseudoprevotella muciniphila TaxID=2133944 RepID=UPI001866238B|nr:hypothetical protein [Pseudoprevotella muciniphila]MBQ7664654.1 hypothetical protein [Bacteroidaceae bacterium]